MGRERKAERERERQREASRENEAGDKPGSLQPCLENITFQTAASMLVLHPVTLGIYLQTFLLLHRVSAHFPHQRAPDFSR